MTTMEAIMAGVISAEQLVHSSVSINGVSR